jgi:hypothetical protein
MAKIAGFLVTKNAVFQMAIDKMARAARIETFRLREHVNEFFASENQCSW